MQRLCATLFRAIPALTLVLAAGAASADPIYWTDWIGADTDPGPGFIGHGNITTPTATVNVTYTNAAGIGFYQSSGGIDYWTPRTPGTNSPYTSAQVDNPPTGTDIIALRYAGDQTLTFSQSIVNPVFAFVSLNGNGYAFLNQDFEILSFGAGLGAAAPGNHSCGYWGCGTVSKQVVDLGGGNIEYRLIGTGEPHGAIRFTGTFDSLTWRSMTSEYWNGFTVGVQNTANEANPPTGVPLPATWLLMVAGGAGLLASRRGRKTSL
ncbi:PEP-CTERM sorting domain-containing protein [Massilia horti]|uniref:PEP-CTERM sorting domain-containing protein n=2 Tax=Massilia horti TaxID=2562153 RepID=A0A4Y9T4Z3_9BURK|nr:PEP-CTERM sorting domain-containing protein [Massilia horti]